MNPFNTWGNKPTDKGVFEGLFGESATFGESIFGGDDFEFAGDGYGAAYARIKSGGSRVAIPKDVAPGLTQMGTSYYSMPGSKVDASGYGRSPAQYLFDEMQTASANPTDYVLKTMDQNPDIDFGNVIRVGKHSYSKMDAIKVASKRILDTSKSTLTTSLGPDYTTAFNRAHMIDASDYSFTIKGVGSKYGGSRPLKDHLTHLSELQKQYTIGGGKVADQEAVNTFYKALVAGVEGSSIRGQRVYISGIKDKLFREKGVVSTLGAHHLSFHATSSSIGKGLHQYAKLLPISRGDLGSLGHTATAGLSFMEEVISANELMRFEGTRSKGISHTTRFNASTFMAMGEVNSAGHMVSSSYLADSRSLAGQAIYNLTDRTTGVHSRNYLPGIGVKSKEVLTVGGQARFHPGIRDQVGEIMAGRIPEGMRRTDSGAIMFDQPLQINQIRGKNIRSFLARQSPDVQGALGADDYQRALVGADRSGPLSILGFKQTGKGGGALKIMYQDRHALTGGSGSSRFYERAMIVAGTRVMQRQTQEVIKTGGGDLVHQIVRASDFGLGSSVDEKFLSNYISNVAGAAKSKGKLPQLASMLGGMTVRGRGKSQYMALANVEAGSGQNLFQNVQKLLSADAATLSKIGVGADVRDILVNRNGDISLNRAAIQDITADGKTFRGVHFKHGLESAYRAATVEKTAIGQGAMSMRMHDMIPMIREQMAGIDPNSELGKSYQGFLGSTRNMIMSGRAGRAGSVEAGLPRAGQELANIAYAMNAGRAGQGTLLKGISPTGGVQNFSTWIKSGAMPIGGRGTTLAKTRKILSGGAMSAGMLAGSVHDVGYGGEMVRLPRAISFVSNPHLGQTMSTDIVPILSDRFLGATPTEQGKFITSGGIRNLGLPRLKANMTSLLHQYSHDLAAGRVTSGTKAAEESVSRYMTAIGMGLHGKGGLMYHNLKGQPTGGFNSLMVNLGSIGRGGAEDALTLGMNPEDARRMLENAGYKNKAGKMVDDIMAGNRDFYVNTARYPWNQGGNLGTQKLLIHKGIARDTVGVSSIFAQIAKGDFDKDMLAGWADRGGQANLARIHKHRSAIIGGYQDLVMKQESEILRDIAESNVSVDKSAAWTRARTRNIDKLAGRMGGAAGGGAFVGPVMMGWARMNALGHALHDSESDKWLSAIAKDTPELGARLKNLRLDKGFQTKMGILQETGVYGILKKGAAGFGDGNVSALEIISSIGHSGQGHSISKAKQVLKAGFAQAHAAGQLELSEVHKMLTSQGIDINDGDRVSSYLTDELFGVGKGHEGVADIARLRSYMRSQGMADSHYEATRGKVTRQTSVKRFSQGMSTALESLFGVGDAAPQYGDMTSQAANAASDITTRAMAAAAESEGQSTFEKGAQTLGDGLQAKFDSLKNTFNTKWGKRMAIGAGIVLGAGALDSILGSDDSSVPQATVFDGAGAPMPPSMPLNIPDGSMGTPTADAFRSMSRAPARIERPYSQRQQYTVQGEAGDGADLSFMGDGFLGSNGGPPASDGYVTDRTMQQAKVDQMIRQRMRSSF